MPDETRPDKVKGPPTERVVLRECSRANDGVVDTITATGKLYEVIGKAEQATKKAAIDSLASDRPGKYRAIPTRSWAGGIEIVLPEKPKPESKPFE